MTFQIPRHCQSTYFETASKYLPICFFWAWLLFVDLSLSYLSIFRGHLRAPHAISCISCVLLYDWPSHLREQINRTFQFRNCHGKFFCSFWCIHGNNPRAVSVWEKRLHTKKSFPVGKRYLPMGKRASITTTTVTVFREFKQRRFWATHVNRKWIFFLLICLDATKFILLSVFTLIETMCPKMCSKSRLKSTKCPRLACVAQKRRWLVSLFISLHTSQAVSCFSFVPKRVLTEQNSFFFFNTLRQTLGRSSRP